MCFLLEIQPKAESMKDSSKALPMPINTPIKNMKRYRLSLLFVLTALIALSAADLAVNHYGGKLAEDNLVRIAQDTTARDAEHLLSMLNSGVHVGSIHSDSDGSSTADHDYAVVHGVEEMPVFQGFGDAFTNQITVLIEGLNIAKFNIFNLDGDIVWSSDPATIGINKRESEYFLTAQAGGGSSKLERAHPIIAIGGDELVIDVVETYVPLRETDTGPILGVMEVYRDVTEDVAIQITETKWVILWLTSSVVAGLFLVFLAFIVPADVAITRSRERELALVENQLAERKQAEEALIETQTRLSAVLGTVSEGIITIDASNTIVMANHEVEKIWGYDEEEMVGRSLMMLMPDTSRETHAESIHTKSKVGASYSASRRSELEGLRKDGTTFPPEMRIAETLIGDQLYFTAAVRDIAERIQTEEALHQAREAALEASRAKSSFLASMSHEIRTPMNAIIGMADLLSETSIDTEQGGYVRIFRSAGDTLLTLINDILDFSRVEAGQIEIEQIDFDLTQLIEDTMGFMALRARESGLELAYEVAPEVPSGVIGDPVRLQQVVTNLIGNSIKFTKQGEVVLHVERNPVPENPDSLRFRLTDTGIGIPEDKLDTIFDVFTQADSSTTREFGGTGLGLAISRQLSELMGGRIWAESEFGKGSTFYFTATLPAQTDFQPAPSPSIERLAGMKTLIVDDNATNRMILRKTLARWGADSNEAEDGYQALAAISSARNEGTPYELVLLDYHMPGMDGLEVAEHLASDGVLDDASVLMLTSDNRSEDLARCRELGVSFYLVKPVKQSELHRAIGTALGVQQKVVVAADPPTPVHDHKTSKPTLSILLAEDSADNRLLVQSYLKSASYEVDIAENGEIAVDKFTSSNYDLVLMDVQMPVMDGYAATRSIRNWEYSNERKPTPIVALTAHALQEDILTSLAAGCNTHMSKPIRRAELLQAIEEQIRSVQEHEPA